LKIYLQRKIKKTYRKEIEARKVQFKNDINNSTFSEKRKNEMINILEYIKQNGHNMYPEADEQIQNKYKKRKLEIRKDSRTGLKYIIIDGKKLFYQRKWDKTQIKDSFNFMSFEQDYTSPHRYFSNEYYFYGVIESNHNSDIENFGVSEGDIVIDAGAAEGNFSLSVIDIASKVFIIESDPDWCEALEHTFKLYKDKVEIVKKYLSNVDDDENITLKSLMKKHKIEKVDFMKMDIEGYELQALHGGIKDGFVNIKKMAICLYHKFEDEVEISDFVTMHGYDFHMTDGYIVGYDFNGCPVRKGILRAKKETNSVS
jgi:hypothetical protein